MTWINTKTVFTWNTKDKKYEETLNEGYDYTGPTAECFGCFIAGTAVPTSDVTYELIENLKVGDTVLTVNTNTKPFTLEENKILEIATPVHENMVEIKFDAKMFKDGMPTYKYSLDEAKPSPSKIAVGPKKFPEFWLEVSELDKLSDDEKEAEFNKYIDDTWKDLVNTNTFDHPYLVKNKGWCSYKPSLTKETYSMDVGQLEVGDICYVLNPVRGRSPFTEVKIVSIEEKNEETQTYNLASVENNHNYLANGVLVHNKESLGGEDVTILSSSVDHADGEVHASMSIDDKVLAASISGLPDTDVASEFLLWEYTGSDIASQITLVTASVDYIMSSSRNNWLNIDCKNGRSDTFRITPGHPLLVKSESYGEGYGLPGSTGSAALTGSVWYFDYAGDINTNYKLLSSSLEEVDIESITPYSASESSSFFRFDIEPQDTYFVDHILIHN